MFFVWIETFVILTVYQSNNFKWIWRDHVMRSWKSFVFHNTRQPLPWINVDYTGKIHIKANFLINCIAIYIAFRCSKPGRIHSSVKDILMYGGMMQNKNAIRQSFNILWTDFYHWSHKVSKLLAPSTKQSMLISSICRHSIAPLWVEVMVYAIININ